MAYELLSEEPRKEKKPFKCEQKFHYLVLKPFFFFMSYVSSDLYVFKKPCLATWILMLRKLCYSVKKKKKVHRKQRLRSSSQATKKMHLVLHVLTTFLFLKHHCFSICFFTFSSIICAVRSARQLN